MKRIFHYFISFAVLAAVSACTEEKEDRTADYQEMSFSLRQNLTDVNIGWTAGDAISVFDGKANQKFVTEEGGASVSFTGTADRKAEAYRFLSPGKEGVQRYVGKVALTLATSQEALAGSIRPEYALMAGYAPAGLTAVDMNLLPALIKLTIDPGKYYIVSAQLEAKGGEQLTGNCRVGLFEEPYIEPAEGASSMVTLAGSELSGTYYLAVFPQELSDNLVLSITDENDLRCELNVPAPVLKAGQVTDLGTFSGFELKGAVNPNPTNVAQAVILKASFNECEFNMISDPSFEDKPAMSIATNSSWKGVHPKIYRVPGHTGEYGWRLDNDVPGFWMELYTQCFGLRKNTDYTYSMWGKAATPHTYNGVRLHPNGPLVERGGTGPNSWSDYEEDQSWVFVSKDFNSGSCYYSDVFAGIWGDPDAFVAVDDIRVIPKGYDKASFTPASVNVIAGVTNSTFEQVGSAAKVTAWTRNDGTLALVFSNAVINGVEYDTAIAFTEDKDATDGLVINRFKKSKGAIQPVLKCADGELSVVPDNIFRRNGKLYMHYFTTVVELSYDEWNTGRSAFLVSEDDGETWTPAGGTAWGGSSKYAQAGFAFTDDYTYMVGCAPGRTNSWYANFYAARVPAGEEFTDATKYTYWTGNEYGGENEAALGPEALLTVGDTAEPALVYNAKYGRYMLIYRSNMHAGLVYRDADSPEGIWSGEKVLTYDEETGKLVAPTVLGVDADGNVLLMATKQ